MLSSSVKGKINSIQSLGTLDGPGIRFVLFLQGCNLRCSCCHNPDTWDLKSGYEADAEEILSKVLRYKAYFSDEGGITVSGGEPLLQAEFTKELFTLCKANDINTCLDTSGSILNDKITELLSVTDRVLLDIKYTDNEHYEKYVGCGMSAPLLFLDKLEELGIPTVLRQVIIPSLNDNTDNIKHLADLVNSHKCVEKAELLAFRKICKVKYDNLGIDFPFESFDTPSKESMLCLQNELDNRIAR